MKVIAVIPAYNEELMIADVINRTKQYVDDIIVVDDCSIDKTPQIIQSLGVKYILHNKNYGAGRATRNGINAAVFHKADIVITLDGDGQHNPTDIPKLVKPIIENKAEVVIATRYLEDVGFEKLKKAKMIQIPLWRQLGIFVFNLAINIFSRHKVSDSACCFRAFNKRAISYDLISEGGFGLTAEPILKARKYHLRLVEVPVTCLYHSHFRKPSMNPFKQGAIMVFRTLYWRIKLLQ